MLLKLQVKLMTLCFTTFKLQDTFPAPSLTHLMDSVQGGVISFCLLSLVTTSVLGKNSFILFPIGQTSEIDFLSQNYKSLLKLDGNLHLSDNICIRARIPFLFKHVLSETRLYPGLCNTNVSSSRMPLLGSLNKDDTVHPCSKVPVYLLPGRKCFHIGMVFPLIILKAEPAVLSVPC